MTNIPPHSSLPTSPSTWKPPSIASFHALLPSFTLPLHWLLSKVARPRPMLVKFLVNLLLS
jgi:hypothetical protein